MMDKQALRKTYLEKRKALSDADYSAANEQLLSLVQANRQMLGTGPIHIFLPIEKFREVDTWPIVHWLWEQRIPTMTSITDTEKGTLAHVWFDAQTSFVTNPWGIPEPVNATPANPLACTAVFVPLLVADRQGHRIGYGKGFYDQFLSSLPSYIVKIGLSALPLVDEIEGIEAHDVRMDRVFAAETPSN